MKKRYIIERLQFVLIILELFMFWFEDSMGSKLYEICLFIIIFLTCLGLPLFLIVSFLRYPKQGQGFARRRSGKKNLTSECLFFTGAGMIAVFAEANNPPIYTIPIFIAVFGICMVILKRYLVTEIDSENEEARKIAEFSISFYMASLISLICFLLKNIGII